MMIEEPKVLARQVPRKVGHFLLAIALILVTAVSGCATHKSADEAPEPGSGIAEYKEITAQALTSLRAVLDSLKSVNAQPYPCPSNVSAVFTERVLQLQTDSLRVRARTQAILSRGDAYFAS
jgi:hypothetical protein